MDVRLYISNLDNREVNKGTKLASAGASYIDYTDIVFRDEIDFHEPVFTISADVSANYNYCSIEGADGVRRYYYAEVINVRTGLTVVRCSLDVLSNINTANVQVVVDRSSDVVNPYLVDGSRPVEVRVQHYNVPFKGGAFLDYDNMTLVAGIVGTGGNPT